MRSYLGAAFAFGGKDDHDPRTVARQGVLFALKANPVLLVPVIKEYERTGERALTEDEGMRGHTALLGALDAELAVEGSAGEERILRTGKVRDGDGNTDLFAFTLRPVELGVDADGDPVRTCVVDPKDEAGTRRIRLQRKGAGLGKHQRAVLRVMGAAGGRMVRTDLAHKLKDEGMARNRVHDAIAGLLDSGMLLAHNDVTPLEVSIT